MTEQDLNPLVSNSSFQVVMRIFRGNVFHKLLFLIRSTFYYIHVFDTIAVKRKPKTQMNENKIL